MFLVYVHSNLMHDGSVAALNVTTCWLNHVKHKLLAKKKIVNKKGKKNLDSKVQQ